MRRENHRAVKRIATILALFAVVPACSRKPAEQASTAKTTTAKPAAAPVEEAPIAHGTRKQKNLDVPVFVDGKEVSVLRFGELPPGVPVTDSPTDPGNVRFYRIADYLKAIGVNVDQVKAIHFAGNRDWIASIEGTELRADKNRFVLRFQQGETGMPRQAWDTTGLKTQLRIDDIYGVNVFVATKPWTIDAKHHCYREDDECKPVVRFTKDDLMKGTRVYSDGKLVGYVKRRLIADDVVAGKTAEGDTTYSVERYLASLGIKAASAKRIQFLAGDQLIASAGGKTFAEESNKLTFTLQKHGHGKVLASVPADMQLAGEGTKDRSVQVTAIQVFNRAEPRAMDLVSIDDVDQFGPPVDMQQTALASGGSEHERDTQE